MTPHYLANLLRARCNRLQLKYGGPVGDLSGVSDSEIIDRWNDTDAYSDQEKLSPRQLSRAIARCETLREFRRILKCPALATGSFVWFRPGKAAVLTTLLDKRYFIPPPAVQDMVAVAAEQNDWDVYLNYKTIIRQECRSFFRRNRVRDFAIWLTYYYWANE